MFCVFLRYMCSTASGAGLGHLNLNFNLNPFHGIRAQLKTNPNLAQVHLPLFDPAELLLLAVFRDPGATSTASRVFGSGASLVGKLRLRLSTLAADQAHAAALPLCADRKAGGGRAATAHLRVKVRKAKRINLDPLVWECGSMTPTRTCAMCGRSWCAYGMPHAGKCARNKVNLRQSHQASVSYRVSYGCSSACGRVQVQYFGRMAQARGYLAPPLHADAYRRQIAAGPAAAGLHREGKRIVMRWLEAAQPPIPPAIAEAVLGNERRATHKGSSQDKGLGRARRGGHAPQGQVYCCCAGWRLPSGSPRPPIAEAVLGNGRCASRHKRAGAPSCAVWRLRIFKSGPALLWGAFIQRHAPGLCWRHYLVCTWHCNRILSAGH